MNLHRRTSQKKPRSYIVPFLFLYFSSTFLCFYSGNYISWCAFYLLTSIFLVDTFTLLTLKKKLVLSQEVFPSIIECYQPLSIRFSLVSRKNKSLLPQYYFPYREDSKSKITYYTFDTLKTLHFIPSEVGVHYFGLDFYYLKSYFGLYLLKQPLAKDEVHSQRCLVLPSPRQLREVMPIRLDPSITVSKLRNDLSDYEDYQGIRSYMAGDPLKSIHFKKSSALGKTMVKEYGHAPKGPSVHIYVDLIEPKDYTLVCEAILGFVKYYEDCGTLFTYLTFSQGLQKMYPRDTFSLLQQDLAHYVPTVSAQHPPLSIAPELNGLPTTYILSSLSSFDFLSSMVPSRNSFFFITDEKIREDLAFFDSPFIIYSSEQLIPLD